MMMMMMSNFTAHDSTDSMLSALKEGTVVEGGGGREGEDREKIIIINVGERGGE